MPVTATTCPQLEIARFQLVYQAPSTARRPVYLGSAWRGALGHALRGLACVTGLDSCQNCPLSPTCSYSYLFETPIPESATRMRRYTSAPHPFVLQVPDPAAPSTGPNEYILGLSVCGRGNRYLPYLFHALRSIGQPSKGSQLAGFKLERILREERVGEGNWVPVESSPGEVTDVSSHVPVPGVLPSRILINFLTPLRLLRDGRLVRPEAFRFSDLFSSLLRRLSMLMYFHQGLDLAVDYQSLTQQATDIEFSTQALRWREWSRYSSRQRSSIRMDGLIGDVMLEGGDIEPFWPYLWLGQWLHTGKGTSMGLGDYRLKDLG